MPELMRSMVARLRWIVGNRRRARRIKVRLAFTVALLDAKGSEESARRAPTLEGHTYDISSSGLALITPAIHIGGQYLTSENRVLRILLELPLGPVLLKAKPVRYERLSDVDIGYLIGVRITEMSDEDRLRFNTFLKRVKQ